MQPTLLSTAPEPTPAGAKYRVPAVCGVLAGLAALLVSWLYVHVFHAAPITTDENSYLFQAYNFLHGCIARPAPPFGRAFLHEMIILDDTVGWLSRYPPGHPLWLVPGCLLGRPHLMIALAAGLSVWLMAKVGALFGRREALIAALLLATSPFFLFTHGTLLSHASGLLAALLLLYGFLRWQMTERARWAVLAGLGWSWLYTNRTYTAMWMAIPFGVYALTRLRWRDRRSLWVGTATFAAASAVGVAVLLVYNKLAVGDAFTMTYLYYDPTENPGFGPRHTGGYASVHTLAKGLGYLTTNVGLLNHWLFGFAGSLVACVGLAVLGWRARWTPLLLVTPVLVWLGYVGFFYSGPFETGPGYYFETLPFLVLASALGASRMATWVRTARRPLQYLALALLGLLVVVDVRFMIAQGRSLHDFNAEIGGLRDFVKNAPPHSLIIAADENIPFTGTRHGLLVFNPQGLDSDPVIVRTIGARDALMAACFPDRTPWLLVDDHGPKLKPYLRPQHYRLNVPGEQLLNRVGSRVLVEGDETQIEAHAGRDHEGWIAFGDYMFLPRGRYLVDFDLETAGADHTQRVARVEVAADSGRACIAAREVAGSASNRQTRLYFRLNENKTVEPRVFYWGAGDVVVRGLSLQMVEPDDIGTVSERDDRQE